MKSKSCDLKEDYVIDKTKDFAGLYKSAAETKKYAEKRKSDGSSSAETTKTHLTTPKRERSPNKSKKKGKTEKLDLSQITNEMSTDTPGRKSGTKERVTSTPNNNNESGKVKSIMKTSLAGDQSIDKSTVSKKSPKKRNKSVSFMLEENEEVVPKRTKSEDSINIPKKSDKDKQKLKEIRKLKKLKKNQKAEKENKEVENNMEIDNNPAQTKKPIAGKYTKKLLADTLATPPVVDQENHVSEKKKNYVKKLKKAKSTSSTDQVEDESNQDDTKDTRPKKLKKKKTKSSQATPKSDGEPESKCQKMNDPDITEDLENLSIGDNAHTLTNMLDKMAVVDKKKKQELKKKFNKNKRAKGKQENTEGESENEEVKEKWKKRRWNKDKKGEMDDDAHNITVIVENLPIGIMLNYRKLLTDHFVKYGLIKRIGIAEVYPTEESKPVFTTTITFYSDGAAQQALQENNAQFEGSRLRVKPALPATETTVVLRTYAELSDHAALSSLFHAAGKIRSIRVLVKGKKSMSTSFIEFDGPESVERALKIAETARLGKKKVHLARYLPRDKTKQEGKKSEDNDGNASDADSEDSNN